MDENLSSRVALRILQNDLRTLN